MALYLEARALYTVPGSRLPGYRVPPGRRSSWVMVLSSVFTPILDDVGSIMAVYGPIWPYIGSCTLYLVFRTLYLGGPQDPMVPWIPGTSLVTVRLTPYI